MLLNASTIGLSVVIAIFLGLGIGLLADRYFDFKPLFTILGLLLGIAAGFRNLWVMSKRVMDSVTQKKLHNIPDAKKLDYLFSVDYQTRKKIGQAGKCWADQEREPSSSTIEYLEDLLVEDLSGPVYTISVTNLADEFIASAAKRNKEVRLNIEQIRKYLLDKLCDRKYVKALLKRKTIVALGGGLPITLSELPGVEPARSAQDDQSGQVPQEDES
jgi:ATP synthase protein I